MNSVDNLLATITDKVLEKPAISFSNITLDYADILGVGIIFGIAYIVYWLIRFFVVWQIRKDRLRKSQSKTLLQLTGYVLTAAAVTYAFSSVGYSLTYLLVGSTALLVGLGFGLQQLFVDLVSGVVLLVDKNINYGDVVRVDLQGNPNVISGKLLNIGLRTTLLETIDNERMIVPNSRMLQSGIKSLMKASGAARFRVMARVSYESDIEIAKKILMKVVEAHEKIDKNPKPTIILKSFEDSFIVLEIRFWMKEIFNSENILSDVRFEIYKNFKKEGLETPYQRSLIMEDK